MTNLRADTGDEPITIRHVGGSLWLAQFGENTTGSVAQMPAGLTYR
jgi:hypothetical protein